jgi:DNA polymerase-4
MGISLNRTVYDEHVDTLLPIEAKARPLRYLFLDLNSYFASVEQQERPELRGRPIAVAPLMADTTFVIAASYEAKAYGVKCGVMVRDAKQRCPGLEVIGARPPLYVSYHERVIGAAERVLPIEEVCSIDEMRFRLIGEETQPEKARDLALRMKRSIAKRVGPCLTSSIGIAPNGFLAKVATEMEKPNGLVVLEATDLPERLYSLDLTDFAGLNKKMAARLNGCGIFSARQMCEADRPLLHRAFGSIVGERWWYLLRGFDMPDIRRDRKTLSHSHVLPPQLRTDHGCRDILLRLLQKAAARLRAEKLMAGSMIIHVQAFKRSWETRVKLPPTQDSVRLTEFFNEAWKSHDFDQPRSVGVVFFNLKTAEEVTPDLFDTSPSRDLLNNAIDGVNQKFGKNSIYLASLEAVKDRASEKIAFNKTWLFKEGKDDNVWMPPKEADQA